VTDPVLQGRSVVVDAIRALAIACRGWAAYPSDHPNVTQAVSAAQRRIDEMLSAHGSVAISVTRSHLRVGVWSLETPQARALAQALYRRQAAVVRLERGVQPDELRALVEWLAGPAVPLEPGTPAAGPPGYPGARHVFLQPVDYSAVRLTDRAGATAAPGPVSLADRLLNVLLEWGASVEGEWADDEGPATGSARSAELAIVRWLTDFLRDQAAREPGATVAPDGGGEPRPDAGAIRGTIGPGDAGVGPEGPGSLGTAIGDAGRGERDGERAGTRGPGTDGGQGPGLVGVSAPGGLPDAPDLVDVTSGALPAQGAPDGRAIALEALPQGLLGRLADATAAHLEGTSDAGRVLAARQTAQLIIRLPEPLRDGLLRAALCVLATDPTGENALAAFTSSMSIHPVLRVLCQLAAEGVPLSRHAQRLVELLASTRAESPVEDAPSDQALEALRGELITLFREEDIDRYNPEDHLALLARAMLVWPARTPIVLGTLETLGDRVLSLTEDAVGRQLTETLLDLLRRYGDEKTEPILARLEQLVQGTLARGSLDEAAFIIEGMARLTRDPAVPEATRTAMSQHLEHIARPETLSALAASLSATPGPAAVRLVRLLGPSAIRSLLQLLVTEKVRIRRRRIFDLLVALGQDVVPEATPWLGDPNWYVVRNVIKLLRTVGDRSSLPTIRRLASHRELRVRLEALRSLLDLDPQVGRQALLSAMAEADPRAATAAAELAGQRGDPTMVGPLLGILASWDLMGRRRAVRLAALQALGRMGRPEALPRLTRFFRERWGPFPAVAERRVAYESLHGYPAEARAPLVLRGLRSRDPEIRAVCERLRGAG
jgi:hypothetical protein